MPVNEGQRKRSVCGCFGTEFDLHSQCGKQWVTGDCAYFTSGFELLNVRCVFCSSWTDIEWQKLRASRSYKSRQRVRSESVSSYNSRDSSSVMASAKSSKGKPVFPESVSPHPSVPSVVDIVPVIPSDKITKVRKYTGTPTKVANTHKVVTSSSAAKVTKSGSVTISTLPAIVAG
jgi:hypothetical protein